MRSSDRETGGTTRPFEPEHLDDPALAHARRDWLALRHDQTAGGALDELRSSAGLPERIVYFYVTSDDGTLIGVVPTRRLLAAPASAPLASLMVPDPITLPVTSTVRDAAEAFLEHRFLALPVVDERRRIVGLVDVALFTDEIAALTERTSRDDVFQIIGIHLAAARRRTAASGFLDRFPWLLSNIAGGLLCALLLGRYESLLEAAITLALFVPVILALAESVSIQSTTLTLQALHGRSISWTDFRGLAARELAVAVLLGGACGITVAAIVLAWRNEPRTAAVVGLAVVSSIATACLLGVALPTGVRALRLDPRVAAGPMVLACADVATLAFYLGLAARWL